MKTKDDKELVAIEANKLVPEFVTEKPAWLKEKPQKTIYCGPNLPGLIQFTIFDGGLVHFTARKVIEKIPAVGALIVSVSKLAEMIKDLKTAGTAEHAFYNQIVEQKGELKNDI